MYKQDLALNHLQGMICHRTKTKSKIYRNGLEIENRNFNLKQYKKNCLFSRIKARRDKRRKNKNASRKKTKGKEI